MAEYPGNFTLPDGTFGYYSSDLGLWMIFYGESCDAVYVSTFYWYQDGVGAYFAGNGGASGWL